MNEPITFFLNNQKQTYSGASGLTVLDYLREHVRLTGTKEGCREGDCGACTVILGTWCDDKMVYKPATSCLVPMAELHGKHLVTVEGLHFSNLSLIQQALIDAGAIQCGFCTPGIVMSMTCYLLQHPAPPDAQAAKEMLSGHLCRCTGYAAIKRACELVSEKWSVQENESDLDLLIRLQVVPPYFRQVLLRERPPAPVAHLSEPLIAGGTDLYVQKGDQLSESEVFSLSAATNARTVQMTDGVLQLSGLTTFQDFMEHPLIRQYIPVNKSFLEEVASWQVRNRATLAGNLVNASPIGDLAILLLALDAELTLTGPAGSRRLPIASFFTGYKTIAKYPEERIDKISVRITDPDTKIHFEKVCKRQHLDIASVNSAIRIRLQQEQITQVDLSFGGIAAVPFYAAQTVAFLREKKLSMNLLKEADKILQSEIHPIDDVRGSARYKRLLARQLLLTHFVELYPDIVPVREALWI
jgi:xanthine dehydrogenase small subunit